MTSGGTALGYYAICFPNPIGTTGGNLVNSLPSPATFVSKTNMLPQSCLGISITLLAAAADASPGAASNVANVRGLSLVANSLAFPFYFINVPDAAVGASMAAA